MFPRIFDAAIIALDAVDMSSGWTAGTVDSTAMDLLGADLDEKNPGMVQIVVGADFTAQATATITFSLIDCDTTGGTYAAVTPVGVTTGAIAKADMTGVISRFYLPIPPEGVRQFLKLRSVVGTADVLTGTINAGATK